jgi:hypothetical protein
MRAFRTAAFYFLLVFSAGFLLGTVRVLLIVPAIGTRAAELLEMPLMLVIVALAARFITRRPRASHSRAHWLLVGAIAFALVLCADVSVGVTLRGMTVWQALFERDSIAGIAYYLALGFLAVAPWLFARAGQGARG